MKLLFILTSLVLFLISCSSIPESSDRDNKGESLEEAIIPMETAISINNKTTSSPRTPTKYENGKVIKEEVFSIDPYRIVIPTINVDAMIEQVGTIENGEMGVPDSFETVGWYNEGPMPGKRGNSVFSGHVDSKNGPAVFYELKDLGPGDEIYVYNKAGDSLTFVVEAIEIYPEDDSPVSAIFDYSYQSKLNLITCTGTFDRSTRNYSDRLVVYSSLAK